MLARQRRVLVTDVLWWLQASTGRPTSRKLEATQPVWGDPAFPRGRRVIRRSGGEAFLKKEASQRLETCLEFNRRRQDCLRFHDRERKSGSCPDRGFHPDRAPSPSTIFLQTARPRPLPWTSRFARRMKGMNTRAWSSSVMPRPLSSILMTQSDPRCSAVT
jgi:hypothetical protein